MIFKKKQDNAVDDLAGATPQIDLNDVYTIGNNLNGDTIINLKSGISAMVLTLSPPEVNRMIRILKATLEDYEIEADNKD